MNRLFVLVVALFVSTRLFGLNVQYIRITEIAGANRISVADIDDFVKIIADNKVKNVFFSDSQFVVQVDAVLYAVESAGFVTIEDYQSGKSTFGDGDAFYAAKKHGLANRAEVEYFRDEKFLSGDDYRKARKAGFVNAEVEGKPRNVTGLIRKADLQRNIYYADALFALTLYTENERTQREGILKNTDIAYLVRLGAGAVRQFGGDLYYLNIRTDKSASSLADRINRVLNGQRRKDDAVVYYMAMLSLYGTADDYRAALAAGDAAIRGTKDLYAAAGFKSLQDVERAIAAGFANGADYAIAAEYRLKDQAEYRSAKGRIDGYEAVLKKYGLKTRIEAFVVDQLLALPKGVPVSFERFAEQYNAAIAADALLAKASYKINEAFLVGLFNMTPSLSGPFAYDPAGKTVQRK